MAFGFGFGFAKNYVAATLSAFNPTSLFAAGEQGVYFDPNNSATLFEDTAGTIPAALERPVGLMLDQRNATYSVYFNGSTDYLTAQTGDSFRFSGDFCIEGWCYPYSFSAEQALFDGCEISGIGNRLDTFVLVATQTTGSLRLFTANAYTASTSNSFTLNTWNHWAIIRTGSTLSIFINGTRGYSATNTTNFSRGGAVIGRYGDSAAGYAKYYASNIRVVKGSNPSGYSAANTSLTVPAAPLTAIAGTSLLTCGTSWSGNPAITAVGSSRADKLNPFNIGTGNHATSSSTARPTLTRRVNQFVNSEALPTQSVTTRATTQTLRFEGTGTVTLSGTAIGVYTAGTYSVTTTAGTLTATVLGTVTRADLREANFGVGLPAYQRVGDTSVNAADYDTTGFPAWLRCSGGQSMVTPSINFTGTDKITVWAGVRKLSDATRSMVVESGAGVLNAFGFGAPGYLLKQYDFYSQGAGSAGTASINAGYTAPITNVMAGSGDISGDKAVLRINSVQVASDITTDQGTGNYGNYPLYLFARNQASLFFNGLAGPIIVRGAQSSVAEIANAENWINAQQKVY